MSSEDLLIGALIAIALSIVSFKWLAGRVEKSLVRELKSDLNWLEENKNEIQHIGALRTDSKPASQGLSKLSLYGYIAARGGIDCTNVYSKLDTDTYLPLFVHEFLDAINTVFPELKAYLSDSVVTETLKYYNEKLGYDRGIQGVLDLGTSLLFESAFSMNGESLKQVMARQLPDTKGGPCTLVTLFKNPAAIQKLLCDPEESLVPRAEWALEQQNSAAALAVAGQIAWIAISQLADVSQLVNVRAEEEIPANIASPAESAAAKKLPGVDPQNRMHPLNHIKQEDLPRLKTANNNYFKNCDDPDAQAILMAQRALDFMARAIEPFCSKVATEIRSNKEQITKTASRNDNFFKYLLALSKFSGTYLLADYVLDLMVKKPEVDHIEELLKL